MLAIASGVLISVVTMFLLHLRQKPKLDRLFPVGSEPEDKSR